MSALTWISIVVALALTGATAAISVLWWWRGRREDARALAGFVPDCVLLLVRLLKDPRVALLRKAVLLGLIVYVASPIDLLPGVVIDDVVISALVLRLMLRGQGELVAELWPGPPASRDVLLRLIASRPAPNPGRRDRE